MLRLLSIFRRDLKSSFREFLLLYIIAAPILFAIGLRFFIPSVNAVSIQFAMEKSMDISVIEEFNKYGSVELFDNSDELNSRVKKADDIVGIARNAAGDYTVILEGNEKASSRYMAYQIVNKLQGLGTDIAISFTDIGESISSVAVYGTSSVILMAIILSGIVIGLNIIEEKESKTISALSITPMRRMEFILGKSTAGFILPIIELFAILWILNMLHVNLLMMLIMTVSSSLIAIIFGFLIGVLSSNQISGIANMKFLLLFVSASYIGAVVLPEVYHKFLYWSPIYWCTIGLNKIITNTATWTQIGQYSVWIIGLTILLFAALRRKISSGLV
ncbi:MAG: ABC transporter permease [Bacillota bacterium]